MPTAHLADRGVVQVDGEEAARFLDDLVTCDLDRVGPGRPRYGGLLTPQGKILFDFIVFAAPDGGYFLETARSQASDLVRRLGFYKLRAKVALSDRSDTLAVVAGWAGAAPPDAASAVADDPRLPTLGWRALVPAEQGAEAREEAGAGNEAAYHAHRIALGVPEGGRDFAFGDAFPHEALMDQLHGVDFDKGCYVGQEVVSRMQHRGTARTRIVPLVYEGGEAAAPGRPVTAGERTLGTTGSGVGGRGLALVRLDRAADALAAGETLLADGRPVRLDKPEWVTFAFPAATATPAA